MKHTCQPTENSLDELGIPKNPYFDPSHASVASFWLIPGGGHFIFYFGTPCRNRGPDFDKKRQGEHTLLPAEGEKDRCGRRSGYVIHHLVGEAALGGEM